MPRSLSWRTALVGCAGVLLPLPLVVLLWGLMAPEFPVQVPSKARVSPKLDADQRMRLATYRRECRAASDCEPPLGCLYESRYNQLYCTDSQCTSDAECNEGEKCQPLASKDNGPVIRICVPHGIRQEGEPCVPSPGDKEHACAAGLVCGGRDDDWCGRPCLLNTQANVCPDGFFCADTEPEPMCLPTCRERGCPEGKHCVQFPEGVSVCAHVYGFNCGQTPCPQRRDCWRLTSPPHPDKIWMECIEPCGKGYPPCGSDKVCDAFLCRPSCGLDGPEVCAEGFRCDQPWPDFPVACRPDW